MHIHIKLNDLLEERNLSHRKFSQLTGIRHPTISQMCNNEAKMIPLENLAIICETLECEISDVLKLIKEPK